MLLEQTGVGLVFTRDEFMTWPEQDADSLLLQALAVWLKLASGQFSSQNASLDHMRVYVYAGCDSTPCMLKSAPGTSAGRLLRLRQS